MEDDRDKPFLEHDTYPDGRRGRLWDLIEQAQSHVISRREARRWIDTSLRVLIAVPEAEANDYSYALTRHELTPGQRYIAVSYCWQPSPHYSPASETLLKPFRIRCLNGSIRAGRARPDIIRRAFRYAHSVGVDRIWIDQECIEQDDRNDKENGIQSMDLVYRYSYQTLALLEQCVDEETDVILLKQVFKDYFDGYKLDGNDVLSSLLERVIGSSWFTRAWTHQEYIFPRVIVFAVAWEEKLADILWQEWREDVVKLQHSVNSPLDGPSTTGDGQEAFGELLISECLWREITLKITEHWLPFPDVSPVIETTRSTLSSGIIYQEYTRSERYYLSNQSSYTHAGQACRSLDDKHNSIVADRLSIIANICKYRWGLDTARMEGLGLGFVACAIGQALFNGDTSLIKRDNREGLEKPFSGCAPPWDDNFRDLPPSERFTRETPETPILVVDRALLVTGCLWEVREYSGLVPLRAELHLLLQQISELENDDHDDNNTIDDKRREYFRLVMSRLCELGHWAMIKIFLQPFLESKVSHSEAAIMAQTEEFISADGELPQLMQYVHQWHILGIAEVLEEAASGDPILVAAPPGCDTDPVAVVFDTLSSSRRSGYVFLDGDSLGASETPVCWSVSVGVNEVSEIMMEKARGRLPGKKDESGMVISRDALHVTGYTLLSMRPDHPTKGESSHFVYSDY